MKNALVTGASGFIGTNLARRLIQKGFRVHLFLRGTHKKWRLKDILSKVTTHQINLLHKKEVARAIHKIRPHYIFNLAAHGAYSSQNKLEPMIKTNILATYYLMQAALEVGFESFIHAGSSSEYGLKDHAPKEDEPLEPNSYYAVTKSSATLLCQYFALSHKAPIIVLRPYSVYGPFEEPTRFIPTLIIKGLEGKLPPLVSPSIARDYIYVDDFINACLLASQKAKSHHGEIYNVGTGVQTTIKEAVMLIKKLLAVKDRAKWGSMPDRAWDTSVWISNRQKIKKELGWQPRYSFEQGLKETISWFKDNPSLTDYYKKIIHTA